MMITVRAATPEDDDAVARVAASAVATLRERYRPNARASASKARIGAELNRLVALLGSQVVGTTQWCIDGDALKIIGLGVHLQFRRIGVARQLIKHLAETADRFGVRRLVLHTVKETGNVPIFEKLGFEVAAECDDEYAESDTHGTLTDVEMQKPLRASKTAPSSGTGY